VLHTSGLAEPSLLALTSGPARLIFRLYEHPSITERVRHYSYLAPTSSPPYSTLVVAGVPDIHAVVDRVASIASVDASKVRRTLRDQWLVSSAGQWRFLNSNWNRLHPFNGPLSGTTRVSRYQKGKTNLDFSEARDSGISWAICKSAPHSRQPRQHPTTQFFTGRMPFLPPNQQRQSTEGKALNWNRL